MLDLTANLPDGVPIPLTRLAAYFSVDRRTINTWTRRGLQATAAGRKLYTTKEAVRAYLSGGGVAAPDPQQQNNQEAQAVRERVRARFGV